MDHDEMNMRAADDTKTNSERISELHERFCGTDPTRAAEARRILGDPRQHSRAECLNKLQMASMLVGLSHF